MGKKRKTDNNNEVSTKRKKKQASKDDQSSTDDEANHVSRPLPTNNIHDTRSGKIQKIKLINFMCHQNLEVDFNKRTNLLIGRNGSGKSAILTALIVGLGSKANATNRCNNIKQLIRTGESSATVEIQLTNDGSDAYDQAVFGNSIIVSRHITAGGSSTYKIKNAAGNIVSTSRSDLIKLILYMNIQVDNPVCVLTQDASRGFLRDSDPKKRFELFLKATQMDVIIEKLNMCNEHILKAKSQMDMQSKLAESLKKKRDEALKKLERFQSVANLREDVKKYRREQLWLNVINQERFVQEIRTTFDEAMERKNKFMSELQTVDANSLKEQSTAVKAEIDELSRTLLAQNKKFEEFRQSYKNKNEAYLAASREVKKTESKIQRMQKDIDSIRQHIDDQLNTNQSEVNQLKEDNEKKLKEYVDRKNEIEAVMTGSRRDIEMMTGTRAHLVDEIKSLNGKALGFKEELVRLDHQLKQVHLSPIDNLRVYGEFMPQFIMVLEENHKRGKFMKMPIGPVGNYIEVIDPKYRRCVEDTLRPMINAFCVDNVNDKKVLSELMKRHIPKGVNFSVIMSKFTDRVYNVEAKGTKADSETRLFMDLIKVDNPHVMNCLIDQRNIDRILCTENMDHAVELTSKKENVPPNLARIILLEPYTEYYPAPLYRSYSMRNNVIKFLRISVAHREKFFRTERDLVLARKNKIEADQVQLKNKLKEIEVQVKDRHKTIVSFEPKLATLRINISELENFEYPQEIETVAMEKEIEDQTKKLATLRMQFDQEKQKTDLLKTDCDNIHQVIRDKRDESKNVEEDIQEKKRVFDEINEKIGKADSTRGYIERNIQKIDLHVNKLTKDLNDVTKKCVSLTNNAEKQGQRMEVAHTEEELTDLIRNNERKINTACSQNDTLENLTNIWNKAKSDVIESEELVNTLRSTIKVLQNATKLRFGSIKKLKEYMVSRVSYYFTSVMELRGYRGELLFDNAARILEIKVIPRDKDVENAVSRANNLSGGERSYSTVAFLMSLWTCVDHPFYFLDEYDVFTDQVNRMYMTKLLLSEANKKAHQQYTFLTPQDTSDLAASETLSILRLANPNR